MIQTTPMEKIDFRGVEIVMPYRGGTQDRRDNLDIVLRFIEQTYRNYTIWLIEDDAAPTFCWERLKNPNIRHVFYSTGKPFPKSLLCNIGAKLCSSAVICFHDVDTLVAPDYMKMTVDLMLDHDAQEAICPFDHMIDVDQPLKGQFSQSLDFSLFQGISKAHMPVGTQVLYVANAGGIVFMRRNDFIRVGGYNPNFEGWGGEDDEMLMRATRQGFRWQSRTNVPMIHLHHDSVNRKKEMASELYSNNLAVYEAVKAMDDAQLAQYSDHLRRSLFM